ncbi:unnamed protein product [Triticum turgidum subsp. durum]|uniref:Uncharacterized protein n=1 Tax=Triticum turgidum subsp. durum TaxID=4567 RepID=A0A9R0QZC7_TRITD|nr:unnamed protein product [Triticum turgidum subsp. durum]
MNLDHAEKLLSRWGIIIRSNQKQYQRETAGKEEENHQTEGMIRKNNHQKDRRRHYCCGGDIRCGGGGDIRCGGGWEEESSAAPNRGAAPCYIESLLGYGAAWQ